MYFSESTHHVSVVGLIRPSDSLHLSIEEHSSSSSSQRFGNLIKVNIRLIHVHINVMNGQTLEEMSRFITVPEINFFTHKKQLIDCEYFVQLIVVFFLKLQNMFVV